MQVLRQKQTRFSRWKRSRRTSKRTRNVFIFTSLRSQARFHALGHVYVYALACETRYRSRNFAGSCKGKARKQRERDDSWQSRRKKKERHYWNIGTRASSRARKIREERKDSRERKREGREEKPSFDIADSETRESATFVTRVHSTQCTCSLARLLRNPKRGMRESA